MLRVLIKSRLLALIDSFSRIGTSRQRKKKKTPIVTAVATVMLLVGIIVASVGVMFWGFCDMFVAVGAPWAFWVFAAIYAAMLCIIGSIFTVKTQIFESKDNDLLLSMPIPPKYIFISRMIVLLIVNYLFESVILLPCLVIYSIKVGLSVGGVFGYIVVFLLLPFMALALSTVIAWIISEISSRLKHKTAVTTVLFLSFFCGYMYLSMSIGSLLGEGGALFDSSGLQKTAVFWWAADAIANGGFLSLLYFALCALIPAAITFVVLDKTFIRITTTKKTANKIEYKGNRARRSGALLALLKKELLRFFTSASYILNAGLGSVMTLVMAVILSISAKDFLLILEVPELAWIENIIPAAVVVVCAFFGSMSFVSAPSISLEDRQLWILQSCPVESRQVIMAKLLTHMIVCTPCTLIGAVILCIFYEVSVWMSLLVLLTVLSTVAFCDYVGFFAGLKFPKFGWQNENEVIKQGMAVMISMLGSMVFFVALGVLAYFAAKISAWLGVFAIFAVCVIVCAIIHMYLVGYGVKDFENLKK